jgi:alkanesulfonate monooxygenase SsuD/methylene tetrahydromethanopterin reductase-like flavin-dependent oxidoreductase (luciferase family)
VRAVYDQRGRDPATLALSVTLTTICGRNAAEVRRRAQGGAAGGAADVTGLPGAVCDHLMRYSELGVHRVYLRVPDLHDLDHIGLIGYEVVPALEQRQTEHLI